MSATRHAPVRRGKPTTMTLDYHAEVLLRAMVPNSKGLGLFVSELVRREFDRRDARVQQVQTMQQEGLAE